MLYVSAVYVCTYVRMYICKKQIEKKNHQQPDHQHHHHHQRTYYTLTLL